MWPQKVACCSIHSCAGGGQPATGSGPVNKPVSSRDYLHLNEYLGGKNCFPLEVENVFDSYHLSDY